MSNLSTEAYDWEVEEHTIDGKKVKTYTIFDWVVFGEITVAKKDDKTEEEVVYKFDEEYVNDIVKNANEEQKNNYFLPIHTKHKEKDKEGNYVWLNEHAGVASDIKKQGEDIIVGKWTKIPEHIFNDIINYKWKYRSIEINNYESRRMSSIALLDVEPPEFKYPITEVKVKDTLAFATSESGVSFLFNEGNKVMKDKKDKLDFMQRESFTVSKNTEWHFGELSKSKAIEGICDSEYVNWEDLYILGYTQEELEDAQELQLNSTDLIKMYKDNKRKDFEEYKKEKAEQELEIAKAKIEALSMSENIKPDKETDKMIEKEKEEAAKQIKDKKNTVVQLQEEEEEECDDKKKKKKKKDAEVEMEEEEKDKGASVEEKKDDIKMQEKEEEKLAAQPVPAEVEPATEEPAVAEDVAAAPAEEVAATDDIPCEAEVIADTEDEMKPSPQMMYEAIIDFTGQLAETKAMIATLTGLLGGQIGQGQGGQQQQGQPMTQQPMPMQMMEELKKFKMKEGDNETLRMAEKQKDAIAFMQLRDTIERAGFQFDELPERGSVYKDTKPQARTITKIVEEHEGTQSELAKKLIEGCETYLGWSEWKAKEVPQSANLQFREAQELGAILRIPEEHKNIPNVQKYRVDFEDMHPEMKLLTDDKTKNIFSEHIKMCQREEEKKQTSGTK